MSRFTLSIFAITVFSVIVGISMIDADAAGNPKTITTDTLHLSTLMADICSVSTVLAEQDIEWTLTIWPDGSKFMFTERRSSQLFDTVTNELIGTSNSHEKQMGEFDGTGVVVLQYNGIIHCLNGAGVENIHNGATFNKSGQVIHGKG
jgi:hypothetical protein